MARCENPKLKDLQRDKDSYNLDFDARLAEDAVKDPTLKGCYINSTIISIAIPISQV